MPPWLNVEGLPKKDIRTTFFVSIRVHSWFKNCLYSCPFVSISGSKTAFIRVHSCPFVVQKLLFIVSIRVH